MSIHSLSNSGVSLSRLLVAPLAVLIALGGSFMGNATPCYGNASPQYSSGAPTAPHQSLTDTSFDASALRAPEVANTVPSARGTAAPLGPRCGPVSTRAWGATSATVRPVRLLDDVIQPQKTSVQRDATVAWTRPQALWLSSASARPPQGYFSDSPLAQESMGTPRSVVLRL
jgi:hypothetical protein